MGDFPLHLVQAPRDPRFGRVKALLIGAVTLSMCLFLAGAAARPELRTAAFAIRGMTAIGSPPTGRSWAPAPRAAGGLRSLATAGQGRFALHTAARDVTFLPGVNLGSTTPGHQPGELSVTEGQYRTWFAAMAWLGIRVVRIYTIHRRPSIGSWRPTTGRTPTGRSISCRASTRRTSRTRPRATSTTGP